MPIGFAKAIVTSGGGGATTVAGQAYFESNVQAAFG